MKKLSFTIENAEIIQENPDSNFALLALDFFASGDNLHNMYVSEETLTRTADSIKNCPLVWKYDEVLDDVFTHDPDEVPCGFVPENTEITTKKLEDGRTMLSTIAYIWKRYTGDLLKFFKRDGGEKPVSVEMTVFKTRPIKDGKTELLDYRYEGITVLGSYVTPAIPLAKGSILSFAKEYEDDLEKEFSLEKIIIPNKIRYCAEKGLELHKKNQGGTSTGVAFGRYLVRNKTITPEKIRNIVNYFSTHNQDDLSKGEISSGENIDWLLWGGDYAKEWSAIISEKIDKIVTFPYKSKEDINPALKGIEPPISLAQANAIANQADSIGSDDKKNGWAIAISSFKKTHHVEDGKWVKNKGSTAKASEDSPVIENADDAKFSNKDVSRNKVPEDNSHKKEMAMEIKEEMVSEMAEDTAKSEETETKQEEEKETPVEQKKEEEKGIEKKFQIESMGKFFSDDEDDDDVKMAKLEMAKGDEADFGLIMNAVYNKFCNMRSMLENYASQKEAFEKEKEAYMAENEELRKFKAELEAQHKAYAVNETIKELSASVYLPEDVKAELLAESDKYTLENIEVWKNFCKAKSFDFAIKQPKNPGVIEVGLPFGGVTKKQDDLWS